MQVKSSGKQIPLLVLFPLPGPDVVREAAVAVSDPVLPVSNVHVARLPPAKSRKD